MKFKTAFLIIFLMASSLGASAQKADAQNKKQFTLIFKGTPIKKALKELVDVSDIDLIYDPKILGKRKTYDIAKNETVEQVLSGILKNTDLDFLQLSSGTYVIVQSAREETKYASLTGVVADGETGKPLEDANVLLADASTGTVTNKYGRFSISGLVEGTHKIQISYVGYNSKRDTIRVPTKSSRPHHFYLESQPVMIEPILVSGVQRRVPRIHRNNEVTSFLKKAPSLTGSPDAIKSMNAVMGVNFSLPLAEFHVQGGSAGEHQIRLDGVPVYNPTSLGRLTGAFSPYALQKIRIHKAGYNADVGSQLSGIIDIEQDLANPEKNNLTMQADPLSVNGRADIVNDLGNDIKMRTMIAARGNIWQWYKKRSLNHTLQNWDTLDPLVVNNILNDNSGTARFKQLDHNSDINFYDLHFKNRIQFNDFNTTSVSFYRGKNYLQTKLLSHKQRFSSSTPDVMFTRDTYDWTNTLVKLEHNWLINSRLDATFSGFITDHNSRHHFGMASINNTNIQPTKQDAEAKRTEIRTLNQQISAQPQSGNAANISERSLKAEFEYSLGAKHQLNAAINPTFIDYSFKLSNLFYHFSESNQSMFKMSGYLEDEFAINSKATLTAGSRFTYLSGQKQVFAEPRFSAQFDFPDTGLGFASFKIAGGIYRQYINQFNVTNVGPSSIVPSNRFWVPIDNSLEVPESYHASSELLIEPTPRLSLRWEGYYKWNPTVLTLNYHALLNKPKMSPAFRNQRQFISSGKSYSVGSGVSATQSIPSLALEISASYQYSRTKKKWDNRFDGQYVRTPWSEPHKLGASVKWNVVPAVNAFINWQSIWKRSWAFNRAYYDYLKVGQNKAALGNYSFSTPSDDYLAPYHQLDLTISYTKRFAGSKLQFQFNLANVLGRKNDLEKRLSPYSSGGNIKYRPYTKELPGRVPSLSIEYNF